MSIDDLDFDEDHQLDTLNTAPLSLESEAYEGTDEIPLNSRERRSGSNKVLIIGFPVLLLMVGLVIWIISLPTNDTDSAIAELTDDEARELFSKPTPIPVSDRSVSELEVDTLTDYPINQSDDFAAGRFLTADSLDPIVTKLDGIFELVELLQSAQAKSSTQSTQTLDEITTVLEDLRTSSSLLHSSLLGEELGVSEESLARLSVDLSTAVSNKLSDTVVNTFGSNGLVKQVDTLKKQNEQLQKIIAEENQILGSWNSQDVAVITNPNDVNIPIPGVTYLSPDEFTGSLPFVVNSIAVYNSVPSAIVLDDKGFHRSLKVGQTYIDWRVVKIDYNANTAIFQNDETGEYAQYPKPFATDSSRIASMRR